MTRSLNNNQTELLKLLYNFRFATSTLITERLKPKHRESINSRLNILHKYGLIGKHYDKSYKIDRRPAVYFLLSDAFKWLRQDEDVSESMLKRIYNDRKASDSFIDHSLQIFAIANKLESIHDGKLDYFTSSELAEGYDHFPQPLPDGFVSYQKTQRSKPKNFFLHTVSSNKPFFVAARKLDAYIAYAKSDKWSREAEKLLSVLFVCDNDSLEKRLQKHALRIEDDRPSYLRFYTTKSEQLMEADRHNDCIWLLLASESSRRLPIDI